MKKIIQITSVKDELWGLDAEGNVYKLFRKPVEVSEVTEYWWVKCIDKNSIRK